MNKKRILVVDDHECQRELVIDYLKYLFETINNSDKVMPEFSEADNGLRAWQIFDKISPDLLITDWHMPGMNGGQLIDAVHSSNFNPKIILRSSDFKIEEEAQKRKCSFVYKGDGAGVFKLALEFGIFAPAL